jgi:MraZ protein
MRSQGRDAACPFGPTRKAGGTCAREPTIPLHEGRRNHAGRGVSGQMTQFMGTHQNRLDAKGRVSIPAPLRNQIKNGDGIVTLVLCPSHKHPCIECWPLDAFEALSAPLQMLDTFSEEHDDLATTLFADAHTVESDKEGRIVVPEVLKQHAGLTENVVFMGLGRTFQIWEPAAAERRRAEARERARVRAYTLPGSVG